MSEKLLTDVQRRWNEISANIAAAAAASERNTEEVTLMAVTKTVPPEKVNEAIAAGCRLLGENRVQELLEKYEQYDKRAKIHFIGKLQTNKVKYIADKVDMIESVDSIRLAQEIDKRCALIGKTMDILLEVNIADEANKSGFGYDDIPNAVEEIRRFEHLKLRGFMTIGRFGAEIEETRGYFKKMHALLVDIRSKKIDNKDINDKTKIIINNCLKNPFVIDLIKSGYIKEDEYNLAFYDSLFKDYQSRGYSDVDIYSVIHYVVSKVKKNNFRDENGDEISNKFGYLKSSMASNFKKFEKKILYYEWVQFILYKEFFD